MDDLDVIISEFRESPNRRLGLIDNLYLALPDRRAFDALLTAAGDTSEREVVRCAAWKVWQNDEPEDEADLNRLVATALETARCDSSDLVRDYAICALGWHADRLDVEAVLLAILKDRTASRSVRSAAFQVLSRKGRERRETDFRELLDDPDLSEEIQAYFA